MANKIMLQHPPPYEKLLVKLNMMGITLTPEQHEFLKEHDQHAGISIDGNRVYCRTCNRRDGQ